MWISLDTPSKTQAVLQNYDYAEYEIRVFVGGINVVTGRKWDDESLKPNDEQDYIVVPPQEHLDGIAMGESMVRQFVAMPIGSGYSIEKQLTSKEDIGGLQLEITPKTAQMKLFDERGEIRISFTYLTPRTRGLSAGQHIDMKRWGSGSLPCLGGKVQKEQKKTFMQLVGSSNSPTVTALYNVKLQIKMPGTFRKHKVGTREFSPFATVDEVARETTWRGKDLSG